MDEGVGRVPRSQQGRASSQVPRLGKMLVSRSEVDADVSCQGRNYGEVLSGIEWGKVLDAKNSVWKNTGGQTVGRLK